MGNIMNIIFVYTLQPLQEYLHNHDVYISYYSQNDDVCMQN